MRFVQKVITKMVLRTLKKTTENKVRANSDHVDDFRAQAKIRLNVKGHIINNESEYLRQ